VESISIVVLAGGQSQRMGSNKALLRIDDRETLIARVVNNLTPLSGDIIVVSNTPELYADLPVQQTGDQFPGAGPLAGLHAGLLAARHLWSLVVACDMPLVDHRLVRFMILLTQGHDLVVPRWNGELEPLHALVHRVCLPAIEARLAAGQRRVISFYPEVRLRVVEPHEVGIFDSEGRSFYNANTPEDWQRLLPLLKKRGIRRPAEET
jgi:molybdopterin-guanine dinucleotide biosynthesis protein A